MTLPHENELPAFEAQIEQTQSLLALISLAVGALIPLAFAVDDWIFGRSGSYGAYASLFLVIVSVTGLVWFQRHTSRWKPWVLGLILAGPPIAVLTPRSWFIEVLIWVGAIPLVFLLEGSRKGLVWALLLFAEFLVLVAAGSSGLILDWSHHYPWPLVVVLPATMAILIPLAWSLTHLHTLSFQRLVRSTRFDPDTGLARRPVLVSDLKEGEGNHLVLIHWDNYFDLVRLLEGASFQTILERLTTLFASWPQVRAYRLGDHEFALLAGTGAPDLEAIHGQIEALDLDCEGFSFRLLVTVGASRIDTAGRHRALKWADRALQSAFKIHAPFAWAPEMEESGNQTRTQIEAHAQLCRNLENNLCEVWFQPIFDAKTSEVAWYEALMRIRRPDGTLESVFPYLAMAESAGLMPRLAKTVLDKAAEFIDRHHTPVSVNLSLQDLQDPGLIGHLLALSESRPRGSFILELLERDNFTDISAVTDFISRARQGGCRIALDDFGSGFSNFGVLASLDLDIVKIDGVLAQRGATDELARALIRALVRFCQEADLQVVAEHIDSGPMADLFRSLEVSFLQGFHLGKPQAHAVAQ